MECAALARVRKQMGLTNVVVMIPFCRTVEEGRKVIEAMRANGLVQGENGLQVYAMCEMPSNVVLAREFLEVFDGYSIGSNDLTQLTLGLDRDSAHRRPPVRREQSCRPAFDRGRDHRCASCSKTDRHLRPGAVGLPGIRRVAGRAGDRFHFAESGYGDQDRIIDRASRGPDLDRQEVTVD